VCLLVCVCVYECVRTCVSLSVSSSFLFFEWLFCVFKPLRAKPKVCVWFLFVCVCACVCVHMRLSLCSVQFNSHFFLSPIGARTLKMSVPYSPPNVGAYTRTPSYRLLVVFFFESDNFFSIFKKPAAEQQENFGVRL